MTELLTQLWTPELQMALSVVVVCLVILYVLSIIWVARDAYMRGTMWYLWAIVALVPLLGVIAYCLLRPPLLQCSQATRAHEIRRVRFLWLSGRGRLCHVPELPSAPEEPVPDLPSRPRSLVVGLPVLHNAHRRPASTPALRVFRVASPFITRKPPS